MKNKKEGKNKREILLVESLVILALALAIVGLVLAETPQELQDELQQLEAELSDAGYGWLVDYSGDDLNQSATIEVYEFNDSRLITTFEGVGEEGWYKVYLDNLSQNKIYTQDSFDLKNKIKIPFDIYQKKKRIDEIRRLIKS